VSVDVLAVILKHLFTDGLLGSVVALAKLEAVCSEVTAVINLIGRDYDKKAN
jgi:hypothetical protein